MTEMLVGGSAMDWILGLVALEAVAVLTYRAARGQGPAPLSFVATLLSGAFLLLALRNALAGGSPVAIWSCLTAGLIAHVADLFSRWERSSGPERRGSMPATCTLRISNARVVPAPRAPKKESSDA